MALVHLLACAVQLFAPPAMFSSSTASLGSPYSNEEATDLLL